MLGSTLAPRSPAPKIQGLTIPPRPGQGWGTTPGEQEVSSTEGRSQKGLSHTNSGQELIPASQEDEVKYQRAAKNEGASQRHPPARALAKLERARLRCLQKGVKHPAVLRDVSGVGPTCSSSWDLGAPPGCSSTF